jgi:hypothetical protein
MRVSVQVKLHRPPELDGASDTRPTRDGEFKLARPLIPSWPDGDEGAASLVVEQPAFRINK